MTILHHHRFRPPPRVLPRRFRPFRPSEHPLRSVRVSQRPSARRSPPNRLIRPTPIQPRSPVRPRVHKPRIRPRRVPKLFSRRDHALHQPLRHRENRFVIQSSHLVRAQRERTPHLRQRLFQRLTQRNLCPHFRLDVVNHRIDVTGAEIELGPARTNAPTERAQHLVEITHAGEPRAVVPRRDEELDDAVEEFGIVFARGCDRGIDRRHRFRRASRVGLAKCNFNFFFFQFSHQSQLHSSQRDAYVFGEEDDDDD